MNPNPNTNANATPGLDTNTAAAVPSAASVPRGTTSSAPAWMQERHSVRQYDKKPLEASVETQLKQAIRKINTLSGQHFQLVTNEPKAFESLLNRTSFYGGFSGVVHYIALVGNDDLKLGYYGEMLVHLCHTLGLHTCWVGLSYHKEKSKVQVPKGDKWIGVIALGTSDKEGVLHTMRPAEHFMLDKDIKPGWFMKGIEGVRFAPSAIHQQKYRFGLKNGRPYATTGRGPYVKVDLGIAEYHFDQAAGKDWFRP